MNKDILLKRFFADNERFADIINGFGCKGMQYVHPEDLTELDSQEGIWKHASAGKTSKKNKTKGEKVGYRDVARKAAFGMNFAIVGVEHQEKVDYSLPFRTMRYDVDRFEEQVAKIQREVQQNKKGLEPGQLLYRFKKDSRLYPVITFVIFYGKDEYDGAGDLHGIIDFSDIPEELQKLVMNYKVNMVDIRRLENFDMLRTDVKTVFELIRYSDSTEKWDEIIQNNPEMDIDAYNVVAAYIDTDLLEEVTDTYEDGGKMDMCEAINGFIERGRLKGIEEGRLEGRLEGREEGEQRLATLVMRLCSDGKVDVVSQIACDEQLRNQYYQEYCI